MKKNILIFSTWDQFGSGIAAYKIAKFLIEAGYNVALMVRDKTQNDNFIISIPAKPFSVSRRIIGKFVPSKNKNFETLSKYYFYNRDENHEYVSANEVIKRLNFTPDLIFAGFISGFMNTSTLAELKRLTKAEVYMIAIDMAVLTGGCHYAWECKQYEKECEKCPAIVNNKYQIIAKNNLKTKKKNIIEGGIKVLALSNWSLIQARNSALFKNQEIIYNVNSIIDTAFFTNKHRNYAKQIFNLPGNSKVIFTGSLSTQDSRKGIPYFVEALNYVFEELPLEIRENTFVMVAGNHDLKNGVLSTIKFKTQLIDYIKDYRLLSLAYQASDVFVCSSIEDSGPMMVSEALSSGTPVVSFSMGVASNLVINGSNGFIAELKNSKDLAEGIKKIVMLSDDEFQTYSDNAVHQIKQYSSKEVFLETVEKILA